MTMTVPAVQWIRRADCSGLKCVNAIWKNGTPHWAARDADGNPLDGAKNPWPHLRRL
jgi:hypothetical protein